MPFEAHHYGTTTQKQVHLEYWLWLPADYEANTADSYPLILFLHGSGERGNDLTLIHQHGLTRQLQSWPDCPFIVLAPQCPLDSVWVFQVDALDSLLDEVLARYRVDATRVYLTGLSLGGTGTWHMAMKYPERFAAIAPICGHNPGGSLIARLKDIPTWVFHSAKDPIVPISDSQTIVTRLQAAGADVRFTVYPEADHNAWTPTYANPELFDWFLQHRKR